MVKLVVWVNGKVRDRLEMTAGTDKEEAEQLRLAASKVQSYLEGRQSVVSLQDRRLGP